MIHGGRGRWRVLWLLKGLGPGGAERLLVSHALMGRHDVFRYEAAYLLPWKDHLAGELEAVGVATHCLGAGREWDLRWAGRLRTLLVRGHYDVLHAHSPYPAAVARLVVRSLPRPARPALAYTEHNRWPSHSRLTRMANRATYGLDVMHLAVSDEVRSSIGRRRRHDVEVVSHGIDIETVRASRRARAEVRAELGVGDHDLLVGTVANLRATKGYPELLAAARQVAATAAPVQFVAVGQGPLADELQRLHAELGLGDQFRFLGYRPDAARVMAALDVFVLASHHEGRPVALMEAMALGIPVVATNVGGVPEMLGHRVEGLLVAPARPDELASAVLELAGDPALRRALGGAAATRAEDFGAAGAVARVEDLYLQLAAERR